MVGIGSLIDNTLAVINAAYCSIKSNIIEGFIPSEQIHNSDPTFTFGIFRKVSMCHHKMIVMGVFQYFCFPVSKESTIKNNYLCRNWVIDFSLVSSKIFLKIYFQLNALGGKLKASVLKWNKKALIFIQLK